MGKFLPLFKANNPTDFLYRIVAKLRHLLFWEVATAICNKLDGQVSVDVQGQKDNWPFVHDSGDVKAAAVLGSCDCHMQCVHVVVPKIGVLKCSI